MTSFLEVLCDTGLPGDLINIISDLDGTTKKNKQKRRRKKKRKNNKETVEKLKKDFDEGLISFEFLCEITVRGGLYSKLHQYRNLKEQQKKTETTPKKEKEKQ